MKNMLLKDYYKTLEIPPLATPQEIKKSFRRLALQYHPDKNAGNHLAEAQFREIQEAYEVLSDPKQREQYNYKRWYNRTLGESFSNRPLTSTAILQECKTLKSYVTSISIFHVDYDAVSIHIRQLLNDTSLGILQQHNDVNINREVITAILETTAPLPARYLTPIIEILRKLAANDEKMQTYLLQYVKERKQQERWDKYKWIVVIIITGLLCWLMYLFGQA